MQNTIEWDRERAKRESLKDLEIDALYRSPSIRRVALLWIKESPFYLKKEKESNPLVY